MMIGLVIALLSATAADPSPDATVQGTRRDPQQIICEKSMVMGTRLATRRTCVTRQQWDEMRRQDRNAIDDSIRRSLQENAPPH